LSDREWQQEHGISFPIDIQKEEPMAHGEAGTDSQGFSKSFCGQVRGSEWIN
jgi:hypothetical protein